jgi:MFS transporter, ACS family, hexuronate transporter
MASSAPSSTRWGMIWLAFFATLINYLDRQSLSVAAPILETQFHLSSIDYSRVLFAFMLAYTLMNGASGLLIDKLGTRAGYGIFVGWWSLCAMLHAVVRGFWSLAVLRFLLGAGEAGNWPGAVKVVAEWFPAEERSLASGLFNSGSSVGAILAPPLIAVLVLRFGWRSAFVAVGSLGLLWLFAWSFFYRSPGRTSKIPVPRAIPLGSLFRSRFVWAFTISKIFVDPVWYFYTFWFPSYLFHDRHFDLGSIGRFAWIPFFVAGVGSVGGGLIAKGFLRAGTSISSSRKAAITIAAAMMTMAIPAVHTADSALSIAFVSIAMAGYTAALANMLAMPADVIPTEGVASVYGLASMGSGFGGMIFALLTGWLVDRYSYVPVFWMFGLIPLFGVSIVWVFMGRLEPDALFLKEPAANLT